MGVKADANPGRINRVKLKPHNPGVFYGQSSEICGAYPRFMPSHWNLSQTIPNLAIIYFTTPTLDTKGVVEIVIGLIAIDIAIEISGTSDSSGQWK